MLTRAPCTRSGLPRAERTEQATRKIVESELAVEQQLAKALIELTDSGIGEHTSEGAVVLRLSQQDLAAMIGAKKLTR